MIIVRKMLMKTQVMDMVKVKNMAGPRIRFARDIAMKSNLPSTMAKAASTLAMVLEKSAIAEPNSRKNVLLNAMKI